MQNTAIQAGTPPSSGLPSPAATPAPAIKKPAHGLPYKILHFCASLRITVVLFLLSFLLVFYGTWAQVDAGIWTIVNQYFRWFFVWIPWNIVFLKTIDIPGSMPYPGGWTLGALLLTNLLAAHAIRFKMTWKRSGILLLHFGIILMMIGEFVTGVFAIEGRMPIFEGYKSDYVESDRASELAIADLSNPKEVNEVIVPASLLTKGNLIQHDDLPFDVEVVLYMTNSGLRLPRDNEKNPATVGIGLQRVAVEKGETAGTDQQASDITSAYLTLKKKSTGESLGTFLVSTWFTFLQRPAETLTVAGKKYQVYLRSKRSYRDYAILLKKFDHDVYPGTEKPRNYSSEIKIDDKVFQDNREVKIWMNHPLRFHGETFYQSGLHPVSKGTILQVVRNPGWLLPYFSCGLVTLGMLIHFGFHLVEFLRRKMA